LAAKDGVVAIPAVQEPTVSATRAAVPDAARAEHLGTEGFGTASAAAHTIGRDRFGKSAPFDSEYGF
jgi:hypothetical protein